MPDGLNKVMLIGNLVADPEMRYTAKGNAVTTFRIAVGWTSGRTASGARRLTGSRLSPGTSSRSSYRRT